MLIFELSDFEWNKRYNVLCAELETLGISKAPEVFGVRNPKTRVLVTFEYDHEEYARNEGYDGEPISPYKVVDYTGNTPPRVSKATLVRAYY